MSVHVLVGCQYSQLIDIVTDDAWTMIFMVQNESLVNGFTPDRLVFRLVALDRSAWRLAINVPEP